MANPNIVSVTGITAGTLGWNLPTVGLVNLIDPDTGYLLKINRIVVANVDGSAAADVDVAILVSGGVDSSFILGVANKISDKSKLNLYTCHIYDKLGNLSADTQHSRNIASRLGLPLTEVKTESHTEDSLLNTLETLTRYSEIPVHYLLSTIPTFQLAQCMHENGIKVCLDGTGGDEIMGGYPSSGSLAIANAVMRRPLSTMSHYSDWFMSSNSTFNDSA